MMEVTIRPMTPQERMYSYTQSQQIMTQTGCIGHLRGDLDSGGKGFFTSWDDYRTDLKTEAFKAELDNVVNAMRFDPQYGGVLKDRKSLGVYCYHSPESSFGNDREYGFRADTAQYTYFLRLNPNRGEYNFYIYCYRREWLDHHLNRAKGGIRFINSRYKELFRISDGDSIRINRTDGTHTDRTCRYIDDSHLEVGNGLYQICEFAELMERAGNTVVPLRSSLPEQCYVFVESVNEIGIVKKGESGYTRSDGTTTVQKVNQDLVEKCNQSEGVTKAQAAAMFAGSMFGWATPAADPANYDDQGKLMKPRRADRGDAR